jgi:hypothetical protein
MVYLSEDYTNKHVGGKEYEVWAIRPTCSKGPCRVGVRTFAKGETPVRLARNGSAYSGKGSDLTGVCGARVNRVRTTITIDVRVTAARFIDGVWSATRFSGTLSRSAPPAFNCGPASSRLSVKGHLQ